MRVKRADHLLLEDFRCGDDAANVGTGELKAPGPSGRVTNWDKRQMMSGVDEKPANLRAWSHANLTTRLAEKPIVLGSIQQVHCA
jgi:hypothetical protein